MAWLLSFNEAALLPADVVISSALELVTCLPADAGSSPPAFARGLVTVAGRSTVPAPLIFSPLAYSLERRAKLVVAARAARASARNGPVLKALAWEEIREAPLVRAAGEVAREATGHMLAVLRALSEFGAALRALLPLPTPDRSGRFDRGELLPRGGARSWREDAAFAALLPGDSVAEIVIAQGVFNFFNIYNTLLVVRLVLTWFPEPPEVILRPLATICDPYLNLFRGIIPPLGGTLDFSPILAFLVLNVFTNSAAALPAELPAELREQQRSKGRGSRA